MEKFFFFLTGGNFIFNIKQLSIIFEVLILSLAYANKPCLHCEKGKYSIVVIYLTTEVCSLL